MDRVLNTHLATRAYDLEQNSQTSQYTYRLTLLLSLVASGIILAVQFPIFLYLPDGAFHAAKILRASAGDYFSDPFTGVHTIYPSLFHFVFGLLNRALGLNSIQLTQLIVFIDFFGLFAACYYFVTAFLKNSEEASLCVLALSLVIYAPTSHYILVTQPSSFSFVFLLFSIGALYRYVMHQRAIYLLLGCGLGSLAVNTWWPNAVSVFAILVVLTYYFLSNGISVRLSHIAVSFAALLVPCLYTAWHVYNISDVLPYYFTDTGMPRRATGSTVSYVFTNWIVTFLTKGNLHFMHHLNFVDSSGPSKGTASLLSHGIVRLHAVVSFVHYFFLVMPFHLLLVAYAGLILFRKDMPGIPRFNVIRTLAVGGFVVLLFSSLILFVLGVAHLRRVHFVISLMFLLLAVATVPVMVDSVKLRRLSIAICLASLFSLAYTVIYSPLPFSARLPESDNEIVRFVRSIPNREHQRIFMLSDGLTRVAPFVKVQSFCMPRQGGYYELSPITASELMRDLAIMKEKSDEWKNVARTRNIKWAIFRLSVERELEVFRLYEKDGVLQFKNGDWAALELNL